jgi:hypothetical protein
MKEDKEEECWRLTRYLLRRSISKEDNIIQRLNSTVDIHSIVIKETDKLIIENDIHRDIPGNFHTEVIGIEDNNSG